MNQKANKHRKRLFLINRAFQLRYAGAAAFVGVLSTAISAALILFPLYQFEILRIPRFLPVPVLGVMFLAACINVAVVGYMAIHITHRMAGPMYSMVRELRRVKEGRWSGQMRLREGDELKLVVRNFNEMLVSLSHSASEDLESVDLVNRSIDQAISNGSQVDLTSAAQELDKLRERISRRLS